MRSKGKDSPLTSVTFSIDDMETCFHLTQRAGLNQNISFSTWSQVISWSVFNNPYKGEQPSGILLKEEKETVAFYHLTYFPFKIGQQRFNAACCGDYVVAPERQGILGIQFAKTLFDEFVEGCLFTTHAAEGTNKVWSFLGAKGVDSSDRTYSAIISETTMAAS
ncbi:hypothetical protein ACQZV8_21245, partial [Magnetococcales bacterium HHB-1]